jgi:hypothetical protein
VATHARPFGLIKRELRRRSAIEAVIGHIGRCYLKGRAGDAANANREINREFCSIRPSTAIFQSDQRAHSMVYSRIPYATEQGISKRVSEKR